MHNFFKMAEGMDLFERPEAEDWTIAEKRLGVTLPEEYKKIVSCYGSGWFGNLILLNPASKLPNVELLTGIFSCMNDIQMIRRGLDVPVIPEPDGYMRLGRGTERSDLLWRYETGSTTDWIWVDWEIEKYYPLTIGIGELLINSYFRQQMNPDMRIISESLWNEDRERRFFLPLNKNGIG